MNSQFHDFVTQLLTNHGLDWHGIDRHLKQQSIAKDEYLFREGDVCQFAGFILKGCFRVFFLKDGKEITLDFSWRTVRSPITKAISANALPHSISKPLNPRSC
jgi:hypothetical protein